MSEALPSGLSIADLMANLPCRWVIGSKIKRGPGVIYWCKFCAAVRKKKVCPMEAQP